MENIINRLIQIEDQAQAIVFDAQRLKANLKSNIDVDVENIHNDIKERVEKKYDTIKNSEQDYAEKKISELKLKYQKAEEELDSVCKGKKDEWVNKICDEIIGIV